MNYAIIKDNIVSNIVEWDGVSEFSVDGGIIVCDENAYIGGTYDNGFVARPIESSPEPTYDQLRKNEYPSINDLIVALWEGVVEERMASVTRLEGLRQAIKQKYPKE
jgi:hypothetical protein